MKVAVTGACGHIGNNLCRELVNQGYKVKALLLDCEELNQPEIEIIRGNILDKNSLIELCQDVDYEGYSKQSNVIHPACPIFFHLINLTIHST